MLINVILPALLIVAVFVLLGCPIYLGILGATVFIQVFINDMPLVNLFTGMFESLNKTSLMSIPFFVFAGTVIAESSLGKRLIRLFVVLLRRVKGGLPVACVLANAVFGAISGSSTAAVATFGKVAYPQLEQEYGEKTGLGVITASATLSVIIPPSITMIIYGVCAEVSITSMFKGGILPGLLLVGIMSGYLFFKCRHVQLSAPEKAEGAKELRSAFLASIPVLILPVIVLGGVYGGFCTPTEVGAITAVYSLVVAFALRDITWKSLFSILKGTAKILGQVFLLVATSSVFSQAVTVAQLPQWLLQVFNGIPAWVFLLMVNILMLIIGCLFDTSAAILMFTPILLPVATMLGINPLHFGIILIVNLSIGMFTPPFGMNIFVAQITLKKPYGSIVRACVPYVLLFLIGLALVTYIPGISLLLAK